MTERLFTFRPREAALRLALCVLCALLLAGCGTARLDVPQAPLAANTPTDDEMLESYRLALQDDSLPLSDVEMRALLSLGEVDRGLDTDDMREVHIYFKHYVHSARPVVERFIRRSQPYIDYTRQIFRERGLPEELAYLAFVESGYNPVAVSRSNAVGMWQFMAPTGRQYGLQQDWWMDERRDPYRSTRAAADYLAKLHGDFGDWHLAVAAYNAGEGKIGRALAGTRTKTFFALCRDNALLDDKAQLKDETRRYVPRFLAMCKIMRNADVLGFRPAELAEDERILLPAVELSARPGTDLAALAAKLGMGWEEFAAYNPAFRRYITPPDRYVSVYVPRYAQTQASLLLRDAVPSGSGWTTYTVARGDSMSRISKRTGVPVTVLRQVNRQSEPLKAGAKLRIPGRAGSTLVATAPARAASVPATIRPADRAPAKISPAKTAATRHTVRPGDTLGTVALRYDVSLDALRAANPQLKDPRLLRVGQVLALPGGSTPAATPVATRAGVRAAAAKHKVRSGETLASLSRRYNVSLDDFSAANPQLKDLHVLRVGQVLAVPAPGTAVAKAPAKAAPTKAPATYKVQPGDTMWAIARKFNIPPAELLALNNLEDASRLRPGDFVRVDRR